MSLAAKEQDARIELIRSIACSQQAIARILNSVADVAARSPELAGMIGGNLRSLASLQRTLAESAGAGHMRKPRKGKPGQPWLDRRAAMSARRPASGRTND